MARHHSPAPIPTVSFTVVADDISEQRTLVRDAPTRSYGYNDFADFVRPQNHYIRYIEPLESDLAKQVEYDMDEQDQEWVDALNVERKAQGSDKVSYEAFEIVMDRLEKEWFDLTKNIPKPDLALPSEDSTCNICDDAEGENTNAIVFCDGCNLAVHQDCYGVPYIPEGQWLCRKCTVSPENPVSCKLCPVEGGAFKQTNNGEWVHLLCAIWVPETRVANEVLMEPVIGIEKISKQRWKLRCTVCGERDGACIQCSKATCATSFHPTCGRAAHFLMPMKAATGAEAPTLQCFCEKHLPKEQAEVRRRALELEAENAPSEASGSEAESDGSTAAARPHHHTHPGAGANAKSSKSARAYAKTYKPGPPIVPALILGRVLQYVERVHMRKRPEFVELCSRYWSLKREARRGAPLLKRLHLEPWTVTGMQAREQTEEDKLTKLELMVRVRRDLETVRMLAELCRKREKDKRARMEVIRNLVRTVVFPSETGLREIFNKIAAQDHNEFFAHPVSKSLAEDYYEVIKHPMCWDTIEAKLDRHEYWDVQALKDDILLVLDNAMLYNAADTLWYKTARRIKGNLDVYFKQLDTLKTSAPLEVAKPPSPQEEPMDVEENGVASTSNIPATAEENPPPPTYIPGPIGDLEPPLAQLELLVSEAIKNESEYILGDNDVLTSIFAYEIGKLKPKPPPQPKGKRARKAQQQQQLDASAGFRAPPRTRRALAAAEASASAVAGPSAPAPVPVPVPGEAPAATVEKGKTRAKPKHPPPAEVVENIDGQQSFKMFEQGWVLKPGTKRGGREGPVRGELPPPQPSKRRRTGAGASTSARSQPSEAHETPATEHQALPDVAETAPALEAASTGEPAAGHVPAPDVDVDVEMQDVADPPVTSRAATEEVGEPSGAADANMEEAAEFSGAADATREDVAQPAGEADAVLDCPDEGPASEAPRVEEQTRPPSPAAVPESEPLPEKPHEDATETAPEEVREPSSAVQETEAVGAKDAEKAVEIEATAAGTSTETPPPMQAEEDQAAADTDATMIIDTAPLLGPAVEPPASSTVEPPTPSPVEPPAPSPVEPSTASPIEPRTAPPVEPPTALPVEPPAPSPIEPPVPSVEPPAPSPIEPTAPSSSLSTPPSPMSTPTVVLPTLVLEPNEKIVQQPDGELVIEELDTPATRRAKAMRKKSLRASMGNAPPEAGPSSGSSKPKSRSKSKPVSSARSLSRNKKSVQQEVPRPASPKLPEPGPSAMILDEDGSELSALSGVESDEEEGDVDAQALAVDKGKGKGRAREEGEQEEEAEEQIPRTRGWNLRKNGKGKKWRRGKQVREATPVGGELTLKPGEMLPGGTLVWAKSPSYPWWPAVVFEEDHPDVPPIILGKRLPASKVKFGPQHLVRFFDKGDHWLWLDVDKLKMLGEDKALDEELQDAEKQPFKTEKMHAECLESYSRAMADIETVEEAEGHAADPAVADNTS